MSGYAHEMALARKRGRAAASSARCRRRSCATATAGSTALRLADGRELPCDLASLAIGQARLRELVAQQFPGVSVDAQGPRRGRRRDRAHRQPQGVRRRRRAGRRAGGDRRAGGEARGARDRGGAGDRSACRLADERGACGSGLDHREASRASRGATSSPAGSRLCACRAPRTRWSSVVPGVVAHFPVLLDAVRVDRRPRDALDHGRAVRGLACAREHHAAVREAALQREPPAGVVHPDLVPLPVRGVVRLKLLPVPPLAPVQFSSSTQPSRMRSMRLVPAG